MILVTERCPRRNLREAKIGGGQQFLRQDHPPLHHVGMGSDAEGSAQHTEKVRRRRSEMMGELPNVDPSTHELGKPRRLSGVAPYRSNRG